MTYSFSTLKKYKDILYKIVQMEIRTKVICFIVIHPHHYTKKWTAAEMSFFIRYKDYGIE